MSKQAPSKQTNREFPRFPEEVILGLAKEFVDLYSPIRETTKPALWLPFCVYFGNAISPYWRLEFDDTEPRICGVTVGQSAWSRKSTGNNIATGFFQLVYRGMEAVSSRPSIVEGFATPEGMLKLLHDGCIKLKGGGEVMAAPQCVTFAIDEINVLARSTGQHSSAGMQGVHKLFSGTSYQHPLVRNGGYEIENTYVSFIGASTPDDFTETWDDSHQRQGSLNRIYLVGAERPPEAIPFPVSPDQERLDALVNKVRKCITDLRREVKRVRITENAKVIWANYYTQLQATAAEGSARTDSYALRFMALQAALTGANEVTESIVQAAIRLADYQMAMRQSLPVRTGLNQGARCEEAIREAFRRKRHPLSQREATQGQGVRKYGGALIDQAWKNLLRLGDLSEVDNTHAKTARFALVEGVSSVSEPEDGAILVSDCKQTTNIEEITTVSEIEHPRVEESGIGAGVIN